MRSKCVLIHVSMQVLVFERLSLGICQIVSLPLGSRNQNKSCVSILVLNVENVVKNGLVTD